MFIRSENRRDCYNSWQLLYKDLLYKYPFINTVESLYFIFISQLLSSHEINMSYCRFFDVVCL